MQWYALKAYREDKRLYMEDINNPKTAHIASQLYDYDKEFTLIEGRWLAGDGTGGHPIHNANESNI